LPNDHCWQVYFEANRTIREAFGAAGYPVLEQHVALRNGQSASV
jgi:small conductance mechanosensitive channel